VELQSVIVSVVTIAAVEIGCQPVEPFVGEDWEQLAV
jgi:hypothetical protein